MGKNGPRVSTPEDYLQVLLEKKHFTRRISQFYYALNDRRHAERLQNCSAEIMINESHEYSRTWFCDDKWCPVCQWKKSRMIYAQLLEIIERMKKDYKFIFLTLTVPNVPADKLLDKSKQINKAFSRMISRDKGFFRNSFKGAFRTMEVTYNEERKDFHPHLHAIVAVDKDYFNSSNYVRQADLLSYWRKIMHDSTIVDVTLKSIGYNCNGIETYSIEKSVAEVSKYPFKEIDLFDLPFDEAVSVFSTLCECFKNRPVYRFMQDIRKYAQQIEDEKESNFDFIQLGVRDNFYSYEFQGVGYCSYFIYRGARVCELKQTINPFNETVSRVPSWVPVQGSIDIDTLTLYRPFLKDFGFDEREYFKLFRKRKKKKDGKT